MLPICVRPERVWPKLSSIQGIRANLVYIVSLDIVSTISKTFLLILQKYWPYNLPNGRYSMAAHLTIYRCKTFLDSQMAMVSWKLPKIFEN